MNEIGLREWKKRETRKAIGQAALALFAERGFDTVTVAEVAAAAHVSEKTVFNYFPIKEDLALDTEDDKRFLRVIVDAIRSHEPGVPILPSIRGLMDSIFDQALAAGDLDQIEVVARLIDATPALQARLQAVSASFVTAIAEALANATGAQATDIEPLLVANALIAFFMAIFENARRRVLAGERDETLRRHLLHDGARGWSLLERGIGDYGRCP